MLPKRETRVTIRILMVGRSGKTMTTMAATMGPDFEVQFTDDKESAARDVDFTTFDAVVLGRALSDADRDRLRETMREKNPTLVLLTSLAPIGPLIAEQVKASIFDNSGHPVILTDLSYRNHQRKDRHLRYTLTADCTVDIVIYRFNLLFQVKVEPVTSPAVTAGQHDAPVGNLGLPGERYAVITVNGREKHIVRLR